MNTALANRSEFKVVGRSGQISLGKRYAGKTLRVERQPDGTILLTAVAMVPEKHLWTTREPHRGRIAEGMAWAARTPPAGSDLDALERRALRAPRSARGRRR